MDYVVDRKKRAKPKTSKVPSFARTSSREGWPTSTDYYGPFDPSFVGQEEDKYEIYELVSYLGESIGRLRRLYEFRNDVAVETFLQERPLLIQLLFNAYMKIREYFGPTSRLVLTVVADPEEQEERELFLFIQTELRPTAARTLLAELDREWWIDAMLDAKGEMNISLEYVRSR